MAVMDGSECPTEDFLFNGEASTEASRIGLLKFLEVTAKKGLSDIPAKWTHEANKEKGIYEFIKGKLRLFFFKGRDGQIVVCTTGVLKSGQKADKSSVNKAHELKIQYEEAYLQGQIVVANDENE